MRFRLHTKLKPAGDQPHAIESLSKGILAGTKRQVLLGVTGSGKTFTVASVIERAQKPTLVISHNKTLAWQLYQELQELFPDNAVEYFVSYYDYYQPEAYIPQSDTYIQKDARVNEKIDQMRHKAAQSVLTRSDTIVVASVSCIYNLGSPEEYQEVTLNIKEGQNFPRRDFLRALVNLGYTRNDVDPRAGNFRAKGAYIYVYPATGEGPTAVVLENDHIEHIATPKNYPPPSLLQESASKEVRATSRRPSGHGVPDAVGTSETEGEEKFSRGENLFWLQEPLYPRSHTSIFPAHFWITPEDKLRVALRNIRQELDDTVKNLRSKKKIVEAQRLEQRTRYDLELMEETGWCHGIENYSRYMEFRAAGSPPFTLLDYFREANPNFLTIIDESHMTLPQLRGMHAGDRARKSMLIEYGFRLPSAIDNRPLNFEESDERIGQRIYVSATPGIYEQEEAGREHIVEQLIRPTGLLDPSVEIRSPKNQMRDAIQEIEKRVAQNQRTLVLTITKRLAEDIAEYLAAENIQVQYLHSEIQTLERPQILNDLREGKYDVLVGINLLREGLDLPETSLVIIFDADKEGFLRNETTLIQTMGRAARHAEGHVIMYADTLTGSMKSAIKETDRRRKVQEEHNRKHGIIPQTIKKKIYPLPEWFAKPVVQTQEEHLDSLSRKELERQMKQAAKDMDFERATLLRDQLKQLDT